MLIAHLSVNQTS